MRDPGIGPLLPVALLALLLLCPEFALGQRSLPVERAALLQLRSSLGIRSKEWPIKADPCTGWKGIQCSSNGRVVRIDISGFRRTRIGSRNPRFAVDALGNLTSLVSFNASLFLLPGQIPDLFGQLASLEVIDLRSCFVTGAVPASLGGLTNLTILYLAGNNLTGAIPPILGRLFRLSALDLSGNSLTGSIPSSFASLKNLSTLDMSSNSLSESIPLGIGTLSGLKYLNLSRNSLSGAIPPQLGDLSSLVDLDLSFNGLSSSVPSDLRGLRNLVRMLLGDNRLTGSLPDNLFPSPNRLQFVVLANNALNGALPSSLWLLSRLILLDVSGNNFTGLLPDKVLNSNATTTVLNVSQNSLYGNITDVLRQFGPIDLSGNYFEGKVPGFVQQNSSLSNNCLQGVPNQRTLEDCSSFYTQAGLVFDNFGQPDSTTPPPRPAKKSNRKLYILIGVLGGAGVLLFLLLLCGFLFICTRKSGSPSQRGVGVGPVPLTGPATASSAVSANIARVGDSYSYQQLIEATNEFSDANLIKHGHSGDLFKGVLEGNIPVVVKKIDLQAGKRESYPIELDFFSKVSHGRFVPFLGQCQENENENEKFLVYKYMPNEDLASSLYKKGSSDDDSLESLDWIKRLKIAVGAAEGLTHLHHECNPPLVHRDVQASSILLDDKYEVRLGSLSSVCAQEGDSHHSRITRLLRLPQSSDQGSSDSGNANCAYDVYCFGKVLLELVTGKLGISASPDAEIKEWLNQTLPYIKIYDKELVTKIVDPLLIVDEDLLEEVWAMAVVARSCLNPKPNRRPPMRYILKALENPLKIVREDNNSGSGRLRATSSRSSWNATLFGSWRHSSSDVAVIPAASGAGTTRLEAGGTTGSFKQSGTTGSQSQGSGPNNGSSSHRRYSKDIFPEPPEDAERHQQDRD